MYVISLNNGQTLLNPKYIKKVEFNDNPDGSGIVNLYMDNGEVTSQKYTKEDKRELEKWIRKDMESINE